MRAMAMGVLVALEMHWTKYMLSTGGNDSRIWVHALHVNALNLIPCGPLHHPGGPWRLLEISERKIVEHTLEPQALAFKQWIPASCYLSGHHLTLLSLLSLMAVATGLTISFGLPVPKCTITFSWFLPSGDCKIPLFIRSCLIYCGSSVWNLGGA